MNEYNETDYTIENVKGYGEVELPAGMTNEEKAEAIYQGIQSGIIKPIAQEMPQAAPGPGMFTQGLESLKAGFEGIVEPVGMGLRRAGAGIGQALYPAIETLIPPAREAFGGLGLTGQLEQEMKAAEEAYGAKYGGELLPETLAFGAEVAPFVAGGAAAGLARAPAFLRAAGQKLPQLASAASMPRRLLTQAADKFPKLTGAAGIFGKGALAGAAAAPITYDPTFERLGLEGSLERAAEAAPLGGLLGLGVGGLARAPQALRKAFGKTGTLTAEEAPDVLKALEKSRTGLGDVIESPSLKKLQENILEPIPFSGLGATAQKEGKKIYNEGLNFLDDIAPRREIDTGAYLKEKLIQADELVNAEKRKLYSKVDDLAAKNNIEIVPENYIMVADEILGDASISKEFGRLPDSAQNKLLNFAQEAAAATEGTLKGANLKISDLNELKVKERIAGNKYLSGAYNRLARALKGDLENSITTSGNKEVKTAYDKAQKFYKDQVVPFNESEITRFTRADADPDLLVNYFMKTGKTERANLLAKLTDKLGVEDKKMLGRELLEQSIKNTKFSPAQMIRIYNNLGQRTKNQLFDKKSQDFMKEYTIKVKRNDKALNTLANPQTGQQLKEMLALKLIAGAVAVPSLENLGLLPPTIAAIVAARLGGKAMTSPGARRWLVEQSLKGKQPGFAQPGMVPSGAIGAGLPLISGTDRLGGMFDIPEFE